MVIREVKIQKFKGIDDVELANLGKVNAFYGRNNSGKSTILHALEMAGLALSTGNWNTFQPKLEIKDLFQETGPFEIALTYSDGNTVIVRQQEGGLGPTFEPQPSKEQKFKSIYITPDPGIGLIRRQHQTPRNIVSCLENRSFSQINGLDILFALRYYAEKRERGFQPTDYEDIIAEIKNFFPEIERLTSDRTEDDIATLNYQEYGKTLDVLYAGSGLKHFVDIFVKATLSQATLILIDEPEMGLHPNLQRELLAHFHQLSQTKGLQFFLATHSPVFLTDPDKASSFRIQSRRGKRKVFPISRESLHTIWGDLGLRPGDLLQNDLVLLVEGQDDVIFFEHIINTLYREEFKNVAIGIVQYGGSGAEAIIDNKIKVSNIVPGWTYRLWIRDRDASPSERPHKNATKFINALKRDGEHYHILRKREIEFYFPEDALVAAQQGDTSKEKAIREILHGDQSKKFCKLAKHRNCTVPHGTYLRELLQKHLSKGNLDSELKELIEKKLIPWRNEILGNFQSPSP